jgi:hypothetical protein
MPVDSTDTQYVQRNVRGSDEIEAIKKSGYVLPKEGGKDKKYWTAVNQPNTDYPEGTSLIRARRSDVKDKKAVRAGDVEIHNPKTGKWSPVRGDSLGGSSGAAGAMDRRDIQLGAELDPKAMMKREGYKKGGAVKSASARADGIAQRGKTRGMMK